MSKIEDAKEMLALAEHDFRALKGMTDSEIFVDEVFGFHAQQAVEKSLKAWISALGSDYPFIHDLGALISILERLGCDVSNLWDFVELNVFAVQFRYNVFLSPEEPLDRSEIIERVQKVFDMVKEIIEKKV
ncbi:MAG: HEPN domain-containing protein [Deltaproteobacteria bacterium]|nr:HEPN domain-containing protein [Deltaproteobacteria bacterium]